MTRQINKRRGHRKPVVRDGLIVSEQGRRQFPCTIVDLFSGGAGVRLANADVPDAVHLIDIAEGRAYAAIVSWRETELLGLKFVSTFDLKTLPSRDDEFLRRLWINRGQ